NLSRPGRADRAASTGRAPKRHVRRCERSASWFEAFAPQAARSTRLPYSRWVRAGFSVSGGDFVSRTGTVSRAPDGSTDAPARLSGRSAILFAGVATRLPGREH